MAIVIGGAQRGGVRLGLQVLQKEGGRRPDEHCSVHARSKNLPAWQQVQSSPQRSILAVRR